MKIAPLFLIVGFLSLSACTWVNLSPEAEKVKIARASDIGNCKLLGKSTVSVKSNLAGFKRSEDKMRAELQVLARNEAAKVKGNTIVPLTEPENGSQIFSVYNCH